MTNSGHEQDIRPSGELKPLDYDSASNLLMRSLIVLMRGGFNDRKFPQKVSTYLRMSQEAERLLQSLVLADIEKTYSDDASLGVLETRLSGQIDRTAGFLRRAEVELPKIATVDRFAGSLAVTLATYDIGRPNAQVDIEASTSVSPIVPTA